MSYLFFYLRKMLTNYSFILKGSIPSKKNSKRMRRTRSGRPVLLSSSRFIQWHSKAYVALKPEAKAVQTPCKITYDFYPQDLRAFDLSNAIESINDLIVDLGIIEDDRWVHLREPVPLVKGLDPQNPRVEVHLETLPKTEFDRSIELLLSKEALRKEAQRLKITQKSLREKLLFAVQA